MCIIAYLYEMVEEDVRTSGEPNAVIYGMPSFGMHVELKTKCLLQLP